MRIGVDGYNLAMPHGTGVSTYGLELVTALQGMGHAVEGVFGLPVPADPAYREVQFFDALQRPRDPLKRVPKWERRAEYLRAFGPARALEIPLTANVEKSTFADRMPAFARLSSSQNLFERAYARFERIKRFTTLEMADPPEIMHWTYPVPVRLKGARNIYTLHDLVPLKLPYTTLDNKAVYQRIVADCIATADHICTVSESSLNDIRDRFGIAPDRITNTYQSVSMGEIPSGSEADDAAAIEGIFGLRHRGYFLYFGAIEPKKNVGRIIEAYLSLRTDTPLVIVGARAWQSSEELKLMPGGGADAVQGTFTGHRGQTIVRLSYLPRRVLKQLARGARALLFPSLYEGFGLPVLESMQLGTPVVTARTSSLPEIVGDAGIQVDPYDVTSLVEAMRRVDSDAALRAGMAQRGLEQARMFSMARYRERLATLYARTLGQSAAPGAAT